MSNEIDPADIAEVDQIVAEASESLDTMIRVFRNVGAEHPEVENIVMLYQSLMEDTTPAVVATILTVAVRRLAAQQ